MKLEDVSGFFNDFENKIERGIIFVFIIIIIICYFGQKVRKKDFWIILENIGKRRLKEIFF